jgi:hypothetical protein
MKFCGRTGHWASPGAGPETPLAGTDRRRITAAYHDRARVWAGRVFAGGRCGITRGSAGRQIHCLLIALRIRPLQYVTESAGSRA